MKFLAVASLALATVAGFVAAQSGVPDGTSCNGHYFSSDDISTAINAAIDDSNSGNYPDNYPHAYEHRASEDIVSFFLSTHRKVIIGSISLFIDSSPFTRTHFIVPRLRLRSLVRVPSRERLRM